VAAALEEPRDACAIAHFQRGNTWADLFDNANPFMAEDHPGFIAKIAIFYVKVSVANAAAFHLQQRFAVLQRAQGFISDVNVMILSYDSSLHMFLHVHFQYLHSVQEK
jgi:hypothetical protein